MNRLLKASKAKHQRNTVYIKLGMNITHYYKEEIIFYADNGNTNWEDGYILELKEIYNFDPCDSLGPINNACIPPGHTKIQVHRIY